MSDPWGAHRAAIENAIAQMGRVQECISMGTDACDTAIGALLEATGSTGVESAGNAMNYMAGAKDRLDEVFGIVQQAVEEAERYGRGF